MNYRALFIVILSIALVACATPPPPRGFNINPSQASLAEASYAVSRSMVSLAEVAQAAHPSAVIPPPPDPATYGMGGLTSVEWSGPIEPLVRQIARVAGYRLVVLGRSPAIPILVSVYEKNAMLGDILRDVGYQSGRRAAVVVFPGSRTIELRYARC